MAKRGIWIAFILVGLCVSAQFSDPRAVSCGGCRLPDMALHTNMLGDLAVIPNIGFEVSLGRRWAIDVAWSYAWWSSNSRHRYWRTYGGHAELRCFLGSREGRNPLEGHHLGIYGQMLTYDFEWGGTGYMAPRWSAGGGIAYGYTLAVAPRLSIDFTIGIGYIGGKRYRYEPVSDRYVWTSTKECRYVGPTRCEVSLLWLIGTDNRNPSKVKPR